MTYRKYRLADAAHEQPVTARSMAADFLLTARLNHDRNRAPNSAAFGVLTEAMDSAAFQAVWHLNRGNVEEAKVRAEAWGLLSRRRRKLLTLRNRAADRAQGGTTLS